MSQQPQPPFPFPPLSYSAVYTDENVSKGRAPLPPPLPVKGGDPFLVYGAPQWNDDFIVRPFESLDIKRLYPQSFDRKRELKKALHSILATFLDLIDVLVKCPRSKKRNDKLEDLNLLFIHFQHLLNEYRVHQARDGVRSMLEVQRRQTLDVTDRLNLHVDKASEIAALFTGTTSSEQAQTQLATNLKWDIAHLQARRVDFLDTTDRAPQQIGRIFDRFMCDLVSQEDEHEDDDWMMTDEVMDGGSSASLDTDSYSKVTANDKDKTIFR